MARSMSEHHESRSHQDGRSGPRRRSRRDGRRTSHRTWRGFTPEEIQARAASVPAIVYPDELPVSARREEIAAAIRDHQVVIVAGETGSGKTTQLPKICLELGRGVTGMIGHTQPRRIAARSVAERIAHELGTQVGPRGVVGYQVRFTEETGPSTLVKLMTDGILLAEIQSDPELRRYDTIIVDEAHERSLNIDFILGYLHRLLPQRPDLKVIITSATIDSARFAEHFGARLEREGLTTVVPAPVIEVSGRTYPVEIRYRPLLAGEDDADPRLDPVRHAGGSVPGEEPDLSVEDVSDLPLAPVGELTDAELEALTSPDPAVRAAARERRSRLQAAATGRAEASDGVVPAPAQPSRPDHAGAPTSPSRPARPRASREEDRDQVTGILDAVDELMAAGSGDILVFLAGERDIRDTESALIDHLGPRYTPDGRARTAAASGAVEVVPLFSRLSAAEQHRVFEVHQCRRIVLATNVAETSLTVPGIRYVIDPGLARISRYSARTKVQRLPIEPVSQASANQRSGRCGRVADGIAIRLYSEADFRSRPQYTEPEILRTSLASVILQMAALGLGDVEDFPFLDAPDHRAVRDGLALLTEIGAIEPEGRRRRPGRSTSAASGGAHGGPVLTEVGRRLARLPIDPRLGRMLLRAGELGCAGEVMVIVAALSIQDVRERPADHTEAADALHRRFADPTSDFLTYLNLWRYLRTQSRELSGSAFRRMCKAEFLHYLRVREWQDVYTQLRQLSRPLGLDASPVDLPTPKTIRAAGEALEPGSHAAQVAHGDVAAAVVALGRSADTPDADAIHRSLLVGLLSNVGHWDQRRREYDGARGTHFSIWPGSGLRRKTYDWVMTAELVETSRLFARTVAKVDPRWVEETARAAGLLRVVYGEPYWSTRQGAAMVHEKVMLYGMTLAADRPATLASVGTDAAREVAREMFIRRALVEGDWHARHGFVQRNAELVEELAEVERRRREHGLLAGDEALFRFYDERVPDEVTSAIDFDAWWKRARGRNPHLLDYTADLLLPGGAGDTPGAYPDAWVQGDLTLGLEYVFEPGRTDDGVSLLVPVEVLGRLVPDGLDWLVPGMRPELAVATIRALPKRLRRQLVPAPDVGAQVWAAVRDQVPGSWPVAENGEDAAASALPVSAPEISWRQAFTQAVSRLRGVEITDTDWVQVEDNLPDHLRMSIVALDAQGREIGRGKDLVALQNQLAGRTQEAVRQVVRGALAQAMEDAQRAADRKAGRKTRRKGERAGGAGQASQTRRGGQTGRRAHAGASTHDSRSTDAAAQATTGAGGAGNAGRAAASAPTQAGLAEARGLADWPAGVVGMEGQARDTIPATVESTGRAGLVVRGYPALVADVTEPARPRANLTILPDAAAQAAAHGEGVTALALARTALPVARVTSRWSGAQSLRLAASPYRSTDALVADLQLAAARVVAQRWAEGTGGNGGVPLAQVRSRTQFEALTRFMRDALEDEVYRLAQVVERTLAAQREVEQAVGEATSMALLGVLQQVREHVASLVYPGFVAATPPEWIVHLPRFVQADALRVTKAAGSPRGASEDAASAYQVNQAQEMVEAARQRAEQLPAEARSDALVTVEEGRWMVEELRVSLFAQTLGTSRKVSIQRLRKLLAKA